MPLKIVYHSLGGWYSDSPRVLHQGLLSRADVSAEHVWLAAAEHAHGFPAGTTTVDIDSPAAGAELGTADLVISNTHLDLPWEKRPGSTYLQTWHGTPLKRLHRDALFAAEGSLDRLDRDIARWDLLLAPNHVSAGLLAGAFRYPRPVHVTGYPRNDVLHAPDAVERGARVRAALGIEDSRTVVLYTPTWRDDDKFGGGPEFRLALDPERFAERLGNTHVLLLRLHYMVSAALGSLEVPGVLDASYYPEISDLYLAADVLVTDYSSTPFDFAVTGKPIVYYVYDLDHYGSVLRGFYFDLEDIAPGPLLRAPDEVLSALAELDEIRIRFAHRYRAFQARFCHREDGCATDRVLDLVLPAEETRA